MIGFWIKWYRQRQQSCWEKKILKKKSKRGEKAARDMTDDEETRIKNYIYMINLAAAAERSLDICLHQKNCELYEKSIKSFS